MTFSIMTDKNSDKMKLREVVIPTPAAFVQIFVCLESMADMCQFKCSDC